MIKIKQSKIIPGLGVIACQDIEKGKVIEEVPLLYLPMDEFKYIKKTKLYYYYFEIDEKNFAIALGYGSLYNHSYNPNAKYVFNYKKKLLLINAIKDIKKGEEIFFNYNYYPNSKEPLGDWFKENVN